MRYRYKIATALLLTGILPLIILYFFTRGFVEDALMKDHEILAEQELSTIDLKISNILTGVAEDVLLMAENPILYYQSDENFTSFLDADEETFVYDISKEEQAIIDLFYRYKTTHDHVNSVYYGTVNGAFVRSHKRTRPTRYDPRERIWYQLGMDGFGEIQRTEPYRSVTTDDVNIGTVLSVIDDSGNVYGVVGMDVTLYTLSEITTGYDNMAVPYNFILSSDGTILSHPDTELLFMDKLNLPYELSGNINNAYASDSNNGAYFIIDENGVSKAVFSYVSTLTGWTYYRVVPMSLIRRPITGVTRISVIIMSLLLVMVVVMVIIFSRVFTNRVINISNVMTRIGQGDLDATIADELNDELGMISRGLMAMKEELKSSYFRLMYVDNITGLINRRHLQGIIEAQKEGWLIQVTIANFVLINHIYGHDLGDDLMKRITQKLQRLIDPQEVLARNATSGFLLYSKSAAGQNEIRDKAEAIADVLEQSFVVDDYLIQVVFQMGALYIDSELSVAKQLVDLNLITMEQDAVSDETIHFFDVMRRDEAYQSLRMEKELKTAMENREIYAVYQPIIELETGEIVGAEILARWNSREMGHISPDQFIPVAEKTRHIIPIGEFILTEAIMTCKEIEGITGNAIFISVNISIYQLQQPDFVNTVKKMLENHQLEPERIIFEITESVFYKSRDRLISNLERLRELGIKIALDDFGAGYSSVNNLISLPVDIIKPDKSLLWGSMNGIKGDAMLRMLLEYSKEVGLKVIIEGVEDLQMYEKVRNTCRYGQGFYFYQPKSKDILTRQISQRLV